jgi:hypothetical protein
VAGSVADLLLIVDQDTRAVGFRAERKSRLEDENFPSKRERND